MIKVSIVVPVYNVEKYIIRCLQSLSAQTLSGVEVLLVDDHGQDESVALAQTFIQTNSLSKTWHIIHTPQNSGPATARNLGIATSTGEYIAFVDGDDWIEESMLEVLYNQAKKINADLSSSAAILDYPNGSHRIMSNPKVADGTLNKAGRRYLLMHYVSNFTTMLFKRDWLIENGLSFPNTKSSEDSCFMGCCYLMCQRIAQCDIIFYHYVIHAESISHKKHVYRGAEKRASFDAMCKYAKDKGLWSDYRHELRWVWFKKAVLTSILDFVKSFCS